MPSGKLLCAACGLPIEFLKDGWVEWGVRMDRRRDDGRLDAFGVRVVHHHTASPAVVKAGGYAVVAAYRGIGCYYRNRTLNGHRVSDHHLGYVLGGGPECFLASYNLIDGSIANLIEAAKQWGFDDWFSGKDDR